MTPMEICRIIFEAEAGGHAHLRVIQDARHYNLVLCEKDSKSILGKFSTLEVAMREATLIIKREGLETEPTLH